MIRGDDNVRLIAFDLPQYHPIPENDRWWAPGSPSGAMSRAHGRILPHYQPHVPGELGCYDLREPAVRAAQAALAQAYGIAAFCYSYYWFSGKRPLDEVIANRTPAFPFCSLLGQRELDATLGWP